MLSLFFWSKNRLYHLVSIVLKFLNLDYFIHSIFRSCICTHSIFEHRRHIRVVWSTTFCGQHLQLGTNTSSRIQETSNKEKPQKENCQHVQRSIQILLSKQISHGCTVNTSVTLCTVFVETLQFIIYALIQPKKICYKSNERVFVFSDIYTFIYV